MIPQKMLSVNIPAGKIHERNLRKSLKL